MVDDMYRIDPALALKCFQMCFSLISRWLTSPQWMHNVARSAGKHLKNKELWNDCSWETTAEYSYFRNVHQWASTICMTCQKTKNMTYSPPRKASLTLENQGRRAPVSYQSTTLTPPSLAAILCAFFANVSETYCIRLLLCLQLHNLGSRLE